MINYLIKLLAYVNKYWLIISSNVSDNFTGFFYKVRIDSNSKNEIRIFNSTLRRVVGSVKGEGNTIEATNCSIINSNITILGDRNRLVLAENVRLSNSVIIIRGVGNTVQIGNGSTFGGIRIVNVGTDNLVSIGEGCLFSDFIELWASDTHSIFDESGNWINPHRPVKIGDNVWVGSKVAILKGVTIESGSIIGMGSVVTKDVPPGVISAGYPNKTIKEGITWRLEYKTK